MSPLDRGPFGLGMKDFHDFQAPVSLKRKPHNGFTGADQYKHDRTQFEV